MSVLATTIVTDDLEHDEFRRSKTVCSFKVYRTPLDKARSLRISEWPSRLECEVCEKWVGHVEGTFMPFSVDETDIILCEICCKDSILEQTWGSGYFDKEVGDAEPEQES